MMSSTILTLACYWMVLSVNSFVNTSAFVVISSRVVTTQLQAGDTPSAFELLESKVVDARISAPPRTPSGESAPDFFSYISKESKLKDISIGKDDIAALNDSLKSFSNSVKIGGGSANSELQSVTKQNVAAIMGSIKGTSQSIQESISGGGENANDLSVTFNAFWDSLQIVEYGPLYVAGIAVLAAGISSRNNVREVSEAKAKAIEAVEAAEIAVKDASRTKELAKSADAEVSRKTEEFMSEKRGMEEEVSKLKSESTTAFEAAEKANKAEISKLESEITESRKSFQIAGEEANIAKEAEISKVMGKVKESEAVQEMMGIEISELKRIVKLLMSTKQSETNSISGAEEEKKVTKATKVKPVKEKKPSQKEIKAKEEAEAKAKAEAEAEAKAKLEVEEKAKANQKTAAELLMEEINIPKEPALKSSNESEDNPWGSLKKSTLNSKTKAQLTAYLEQRNIDVVASMKKADLISTIQEL